MRAVGFLAAVAACSAVFATGCGGSDEKKDDSPSPAEARAHAAQGTVAVTNKLEGHRFQGSGFIVDARRGLVLTSTATIWDKGTIEVQTSEGRTLHARLAARSPCDDVSLLVLHPRPPGLEELKIAKGETAKDGDKVTAIGYPASFRSRNKSNVSSTHGTLSAAYVPADLQRKLPNFPALLQHQAPLARGTSGGPLINEAGEVVGMNTTIDGGKRRGGDSGVYYAIANTHIQDMLDELKPAKRFIYEGWEKRHHCHELFGAIIRRQRGFTPSHLREEDHAHHAGGGSSGMSSGGSSSGMSSGGGAAMPSGHSGHAGH